ncbi:uncharacterized protein CXorf38 homolog [Mixophyes fleayi]|uniref:uncharacterized protein CXorf38 homolog n=1 Tax=Mixophyes fleayi TaxID=3061075 RepID=UPI003F4D9075
MALAGFMRRLNSREYKNWIKAGQCLTMLQSRMQGFINSEMQSFHRQLASKMTATPRQRKRCQCRAKGKQFQPNCPICAEWKENILAHHNNRNGEIHWGNCDPSLWPTHYWEVAKVYLPRGHAQSKGPQQCDAAAFLNLINTCDRFKVSNISRIREVIKCRNDLMHNSDMKVSSSWLADFGQKMHELISEFTHVPGLEQEGYKMQEVLLSDWSVEDVGLYEVDGHVKPAYDPSIVVKMKGSVVDTPNLSLCEVEIQLIQQLLQELYLQIEEQGTLSKEDQDNISKVKDFLSEYEDLQSVFQEDLERLDLLQKDNVTLNVES